ncbi:MAG: dynamin family protein [Ilumatobacteraceae bacterium]
MSTETLMASVRELLDAAEPVLGERANRIAPLRDRLDGPLRVAIAGKVKAGKSTLLNALVGERVAPTDAGERTRIVTRYRNSHVYRVTAVPWAGEPVELRFRRTERDLDFTLEGHRADDIHYVDVEWPAGRLRDLELIDTPGLASVSDDVSRRTRRFLGADEDGPGGADAVVYLMRHLHPTDVSFLEAFRDNIATLGASVNAIGVLSRADEIGSARPNAMVAAERIAARYRADPRINGLCQVVIPVAGLIAEGATTLRQDEADALRAIALLDVPAPADLLVSVQRFTTLPAPPGLEPDVRARLLDRFGLFGVRLAVELIGDGRVNSAAELADALELTSGIHELRHVLRGHFASRAAVLKARSTLATVWALADQHGGPDGRRLRERIRDIELAAHELVEIRLLSQLRRGAIELGPAEPEARRILGDDGADPTIRLGLTDVAAPDEVRSAAIDTIARWRITAQDPLLGRAARELVEGVVRSCEALAAPT